MPIMRAPLESVTVKMITGKRIRNRRIELGMTVDELAEKLSVHRIEVFRYERGQLDKMPSSMLSKLSALLECTPEYLIEISDEPLQK